MVALIFESVILVEHFAILVEAVYHVSRYEVYPYNEELLKVNYSLDMANALHATIADRVDT